MALRIYNNIPALTSQRYLSTTNSDMSKNLERLSSGLRINSAADDASGLAISEKLRGQISGLQRASMNAQDGISLLQTAEGGLSVITDMTQRMRELAVQAGNGVYTSSDRAEIQKEIDQLKEEINRVASSTEFNTKKLLNGDSTALWSTDKGDVIDATITGVVAEGNYELELDVTAGKNYIYKTNVMSLNEDAIAAEITTAGGTSNSSNATAVSEVVGMAATGTSYYTVAVGDGTSTGAATVIATYAQEGSSFVAGSASLTINSADEFKGGYVEIQFTEGMDTTMTAADTYNFKARFIDATTGVASEWTDVTDGVSYDASGNATVTLTGLSSHDIDITFEADLGGAGEIQAGDKVLFAVSKEMTTATNMSGGGSITISDGPNGQDGPTVVFTAANSLTLEDNGDDEIDYKNITVYHAYLDEETGNLNVGSLTFDFKEAYSSNTSLDDEFQVEVRGGGEAATTTTELRDIARFTTDDGNNLFSQTQELTIYGNGTSTTIFLEGKDTIADFEQKLTDAIVNGLGMGASTETSDSVSSVNSNLVNYVTTETDNSNEAVAGTFVIQSALLGDNSQLTFSGDQALIDGLSLDTIQYGENSEVEVTVTDAHTGSTVGSDTVNDYTLRNVIQGVNVNIASDAGLSISWDDSNKEMTFAAGDTEKAKLHVVDNAMEMQIGPNEGQTISTAIPQIDTESLGLDDIIIVDQELAQQAITKIDNALDQINSVRATIGAQINRLEYTITGLDVTRENLTASESRIRDLDFASEMTEFTRNQILNQAGVAMLSQANAMPQLALQLLA